jgi:hypothetical protein
VALTTDDEAPEGVAVANRTYDVGSAEPLFPTDVRICPEKVQLVGSVNSSKAVEASGGEAKVMEYVFPVLPAQLSVGFNVVPPDDVRVMVPAQLETFCMTPLVFSTATSGAVAPATVKLAPDAPTAGCFTKTRVRPGAEIKNGLLVAFWKPDP